MISIRYLGQMKYRPRFLPKTLPQNARLLRRFTPICRRYLFDILGCMFCQDYMSLAFNFQTHLNTPSCFWRWIFVPYLKLVSASTIFAGKKDDTETHVLSTLSKIVIRHDLMCCVCKRSSKHWDVIILPWFIYTQWIKEHLKMFVYYLASTFRYLETHISRFII